MFDNAFPMSVWAQCERRCKFGHRSTVGALNLPKLSVSQMSPISLQTRNMRNHRRVREVGPTREIGVGMSNSEHVREIR